MDLVTKMLLWIYYTVAIAITICLLPLVAVVSLVFDDDR